MTQAEKLQEALNAYWSEWPKPLITADMLVKAHKKNPWGIIKVYWEEKS